MYVVSDPHEIFDHCYNYLESHMDADSVSHMMHCNHLINDDDYEAITAAPNDTKINTALLHYFRSMNSNQLIKFCDILKKIETQRKIGVYLSYCKYMKYNRYYEFVQL